MDDKNVKVMDYKKGMYFGEIALLKNDTRQASIIATSDKVECLSIERETFNRILGPLSDLLKRNMVHYAKF